jgi:stress-induced morphogen
MADQRLKTKIESVLRKAHFRDATDLVDVSDGDDGDIHVVVVSRKFDGMRMKEKHDLIWDALMGGLRPQEWQQVTLSIGKSPEEIKAGF